MTALMVERPHMARQREAETPGRLQSFLDLYDANQKAVCRLSSLIEDSNSATIKLALTKVRDDLLASSEIAQLYSDLKPK